VDNANHDGEGFFTYTVQPKAGLPTGTPISAQASIVFDTNAPLATPMAHNTLDASGPTSTVATLPATTTTARFPLSWSGSDDAAGSGMAHFDIYVSDSGGAFTFWQSFPGTQTSATFTGQDGHSYAFSSVATDNVGNREVTPFLAEAGTRVQLPPPAPPPPSPTPTPVLPRGITAKLITVKVGKKKKRLDILVSFADNGAKKNELASPFQSPAFKNIQVSVQGGNIVVTARKGKKTVTQVIPG
jgi:hypothetical protein